MNIVQQSVGLSDRTMPGPITAGNLLVIVASSRGGAISPTGYTAAQAVTENGATDKCGIFYKVAGVGESASLTGMNLDMALGWYELSGYGGALDAEASTGSGYVISTGTVTMGENDVAFAVGIIGSGGGFDAGGPPPTGYNSRWTPGSGWSEDWDSRVFSGHPATWIAHRLGAGTVSADASFLNDGQGPWPWGAQVVSFTGLVAPPVPGVDLPVYDPGNVFLGDLSEVFDVQIRIELNGTGSGRFSINRHSAEATADLLKPGNYVRVTIPQIDPNPIFGFFLEAGDFKLVSSDEEGGEIINFGGRGGLAYWDRAIWLAQSFLIQWWPSYMSTPPAGAIGAIALLAGTYIDYGVSGGSVVSENPFSTGGFSAYYDSIRTFHRSGGRSDITLVHLVTSAHSGDWIHSSGTGIKRYPNKGAFVLGDSILMKNIGTGTKPGEVLHSMYLEAIDAARPEHPIPGMTIDFDATNDSDGNPWTETDALAAVSAQLNDDYLSTIVKLVDTGVLDVAMGPDLDMHAYNAYGRDLHGAFGGDNVRFEKGVNIADELVREYSDQPIGTFAQVVGNEEGAIAFATLATPYAPREIGINGESSDTTALEALGQAELEARLLHSDAIGFAVATPIIGAEDPDNGLYLPGPPGSARGNYWVGDLATLHTGSGEHDFDDDTIRIAAITMSFTGSNDLAVVVEMNSAFGGRAASEMGARGGSPSTGSTGGSSATLSDLYQLVSERDQPEGYPSLDENARVDFREIETSWKTSVRAVSLVNVDLSADAAAGDTVGGVTLAEGDDVLYAGQTDASENGIRTTQTTGEPPRRLDMTVGEDVLGAVVLVREGTGAGKIYYSTTVVAPTIDTDDIDFTEFASGGASALDDLSDVTITSASNADRLRYNSTSGQWENSDLVWEPMIASDGTVMTDGLLNPMLAEVSY